MKKNTQNLFNVFTFFFISFFSSCNDRSEPVPQQIISPILKTYFEGYQEGTKWEYEIEGTNETIVEEVTACSPGWTEIKTPIKPFNYIFRIEDGNFFSILCRDEWSSTGHGISAQADTIREFQYLDDGVEILDSLKSKYHKFNKVIKRKDYRSDIYFTEIYFAPNIGIVKKVERQRTMDSPKVYILKSYTIKR